MSEVQRHFLDINGNHFVAVFSDQKEAKAYIKPPGATELPLPPRLSGYVWRDASWVELPKPGSKSPEEKLAEFLAANPDVKALTEG